MSYQAFARKWRPRQFSDVLGQQHVVAAISNALDSDRVHHAYLFTGTRGVGKTTLARIFARALNCERGVSSTPCGECNACHAVDTGNFIDLLEVDAASRTRVDDTRELLDNVQYAPTQGRFKIYLIDEVHMLSTHSFNALLKTLEEPPSHVKFLLATTDPQKLPATILSRCIQFNLKAMDVDQLDHQLEHILTAEEIASDPEARRILARAADGSVRDALSLLEQAVAFGNGEVRSEQVRGMLGMIDDRFVADLLERVVERDGAGLLDVISAMAERAVDYGAALNDILGRIHYAALYQISPEAVEARGVDGQSVAPLAEATDPELLQLLYQLALVGKRDFSIAPDPRTGFEMAMLRLAAFQPAGKGATGSGTAPALRAGSPVHQSGPAGSRRQIENRSGSDAGGPSPAQRIASERANGTSAGRADRPANDVAANKVSDSNREQAPTASMPPLADQTPAVAESAPPEQSQSTSLVNMASLSSPRGWAEFVERCGLTGMVRELVMNMTPVGAEGNCLDVQLDQNARHLMNDDRIARIERQLGEELGHEFWLSVDVAALAEGTVATPSRQKQQATADRQQAAEQAFEQDPNVQALVDLFDAEVISDSVRPPAD